MLGSEGRGQGRDDWAANGEDGAGTDAERWPREQSEGRGRACKGGRGGRGAESVNESLDRIRVVFVNCPTL